VGSKPDNKGICHLQFTYNLSNYFRGFRILANREEANERQVSHLSDSNEFGLCVTKLSTSER
jgi:hypothetical protein